MRPQTLFLTLVLLFSFFQPVQAQQAPQKLEISEPGFSYQFGESLTFQAKLNLPAPAAEVFLIFQAEGESQTHVLPLTPDAEGKTTVSYDLKQNPLRPFSRLQVFYRAKLQSGEELVSDSSTFEYLDNRFPWQALSGAGITIHWSAGDLSFGQAAMDVAQRGLKRARELLLVIPSQPIEIYIYASAIDLQKALEIGGRPWVGGHASPDQRLALVAVAPGPDQGLEFDRKIPHELSHILTFDLTQERYDRLPVWLREGIATQTELSANPDYPLALKQAAEQGNLIPVAELCPAFPQDTGRVFLAYAEAQSFTSYLIQKYGQTGLLALIKAYGDGLDCQQGSLSALGQPLDTLDQNWRANVLGDDVGAEAFKNLFPYLALLVVLVSVSLVSALTFKRPADVS
jgi:hypothetical protein